MNQERLYKSRSAKACITAAVTIYLQHFKSIFKTTLWRVALFALTTAAYLSFTLLYIPLHSTESGFSTVHLSVAVILLLAMLFGYTSSVKAYATAVGGNRLRGRYRGMVSSIVLLTLLVVGIIYGTSYLSDLFIITNKELASLTQIGIFTFLLGILAPPILFVCIRHLVLRRRKKHKVSVTSSFRHCFRYGGILYITFILSALITLLVAALPSLPMIIIALARRASFEGMEFGDASGLTSSFHYAYFFTTFLTTFFFTYLSCWFFTVNAYCFGSIEYDERERTKVSRVTSTD